MLRMALLFLSFRAKSRNPVAKVESRCFLAKNVQSDQRQLLVEELWRHYWHLVATCRLAKEKGCLSAPTLIFTKNRAAFDTLATGMDENNRRKSTNLVRQSCSDRGAMKDTEWRK